MTWLLGGVNDLTMSFDQSGKLKTVFGVPHQKLVEIQTPFG
jgi:hypothetical protein